MQASVKIMGTDVDMLSNDVFIKKINEYLTTEQLQVIFFASAELLKQIEEDENNRRLLDITELFLPGMEELLKDYQVEELKAGDMVVSCKSFGLVLENLKKEDRTVYIVAESEEDAGMLKDYCLHMQPELKIIGASIYATDTDGAAVVNEINSKIPDFLLLDLPIGKQEDFIVEHIAHLNAKLCIAIGGVAELVMASKQKKQGLLEKLHLDSFFHKIFTK